MKKYFDYAMAVLLLLSALGIDYLVWTGLFRAAAFVSGSYVAEIDYLVVYVALAAFRIWRALWRVSKEDD